MLCVPVMHVTHVHYMRNGTSEPDIRNMNSRLVKRVFRNHVADIYKTVFVRPATHVKHIRNMHSMASTRDPPTPLS